MKKLILIILCLSLNFTFSQKKGGKVGGFLNSEEYSIENEYYIKLNFQKHSNENTSYKIKFFHGINGLEFWGHHEQNAEQSERYFSVLTNDFKMNLKGPEIQNFYDKIFSNYKTYQKEIRIKRPNVHLDINLNEEGTLSFSSHMIALKSNYAFWLNGVKYTISEKDFLKFMTEFRLFYDFKKVEIETD